LVYPINVIIIGVSTGLVVTHGNKYSFTPLNEIMLKNCVKKLKNCLEPLVSVVGYLFVLIIVISIFEFVNTLLY